MLIDDNIQTFEKIDLEMYVVNTKIVSWIVVVYCIIMFLKLKVKEISYSHGEGIYLVGARSYLWLN